MRYQPCAFAGYTPDKQLIGGYDIQQIKFFNT